VSEPSQEALETGLKALARRELSHSELVARITRSGIDPVDAEVAASRLAEAGYQSDERTACERARVLAGRRYGDLAIRTDLGSRGIAESEIEQAIAGVEPEIARAEALSRRGGNAAKLAQALRRKGYTEDTVEAALRSPDPQG